MEEEKKGEILDALRERKGDEWIEEHRELPIAQSRHMGADVGEESDAISQEKQDTDNDSDTITLDLTGDADANWLQNATVEDAPKGYSEGDEDDQQWAKERYREMTSVVYVFGGDRMRRVTAALEDRYEVFYQRDVVGDPWWKRFPLLNLLPMLLLTNAFIRRERPVVIVDRFLLRRLVLLPLCRYHGCPYVARTRGSMCGEFRDRHSHAHPVVAWAKSAVGQVFRDVVLRRADRIMAVSYFNRMQIVYELGVDPDRIDVVYESCDVEAFDEVPTGRYKAEGGLPANGNLLLTVTNFDYDEKIEGIRYYFPEVESFLQSNPGWHYVVAGDGAHFEEFRASLLAGCDPDVRDRVSLVGFYSPIERLFAEADIVCHPSFRDALPNAVIEAQAARKPVVVNSDGGMQESLPDEFRHYQVVDEREEFRESIETLAADPELRQVIGELNHEVAERRFCGEAVAEMFDASMERLATTRRGG